MDQLRLLRAENAFYRACAAVRQSGVELQQVRGFLLQELLAVEVDKRGRLDREAAETIKELQVCKQNYQRELSRLRNQLQAQEDNSPESAAVYGDDRETEGIQGKREGEREAIKLQADGLAGSETGSMKEGSSDVVSQLEEVGSGADTHTGVEVGERQQSPAVIRKARRKFGRSSKGTRRNVKRNPVQSKSQSGVLQPEHDTHTCLQPSDMDSPEFGGRRSSQLREDSMAVNQLQDFSTEVLISKYHLNEVREESVLGAREPVEGPLAGEIGQSQQDGELILGGSEENKRKLDGEPLSGGSKQSDSIQGGNEQSRQGGGLVSEEGGQSQPLQDGRATSGKNGQKQQDGGRMSAEDGQGQQDYVREKPVLGGGGQDNSHSVTSVVKGVKAVSGGSRPDCNDDVTFVEQQQTSTEELDKTEPCLPPTKTKELQRSPSQAQEGNSLESAAVCDDVGESAAMQEKREGEREAVKLGEDGLAGSGKADGLPEMKEGCSNGISPTREVGSGADTQNGVEVEEEQQSPAVIRKPRPKYRKKLIRTRRKVRRTPVQSKSQSGELQLERSDMDSEEAGGKRPRLLGEVREGDTMAGNQLQDSSTKVPVSKYHLDGVGEESVLGESEPVEEPLLGPEDRPSQEGYIREKPVLGGGEQDNGDNVTSIQQGGEAVPETQQDGNVDVACAEQPRTATGELDQSEPCPPPAKTKDQTAKKRTAGKGRPPSKKKCDLSTQPAVQPQMEEGILRGCEVSPEIPLQNRAGESVPPDLHPVGGGFRLNMTVNPTDGQQGKARLFASQDTTLVPTTKRRKTLPCKRAKDSSQLSIVDTKATPTRKTTVRVNTRGFIAPKLKSLKRDF